MTIIVRKLHFLCKAGAPGSVSSYEISMIFLRELEVLGGFLGGAALIYLKYRQTQWSNEQRDQKADVQTLFDGEK